MAVGWIDYSKAYDMTPHPWVRAVLRAIKAPKVVQRGLRKLMKACLQIPVEGGITHREVKVIVSG